MNRFFLSVPVMFLLAGCAGFTQGFHQSSAKSADDAAPAEQVVDQVLRDTGGRVEQVLLRLDQAKQSVDTKDAAMPETAAYQVTVDWDGAIEPVLKVITSKVGMGFIVIGKPMAPVLVSIHVKDAPILEVFRVLGMQAGKSGDIVYRRKENIVEIRYRQND